VRKHLLADSSHVLLPCTSNLATCGPICSLSVAQSPMQARRMCSCGENMLHSRGSAPVCKGVRENTIASFKQAASLNVAFIEFDVQVGTFHLPFLAWLWVPFHVVQLWHCK
jgi:Glycerophosphoryl diester phosphodiesterase family